MDTVAIGGDGVVAERRAVDVQAADADAAHDGGVALPAVHHADAGNAAQQFRRIECLAERDLVARHRRDVVRHVEDVLFAALRRDNHGRELGLGFLRERGPGEADAGGGAERLGDGQRDCGTWNAAISSHRGEPHGFLARPAGRSRGPRLCECTRAMRVRCVGRKADVRVAKTLERLPESLPAALAHVRHEIEVELERDDLAPGARHIKRLAARTESRGAAIAEVARAVEVDEVTLIRRGRGARDRDLDVAVDGVGEAGMQDDLGAHPGERARRLRKPHVVADRDAEAPDVRDVEDRVLVAARDIHLIGLERVDLAVTGNDLARGVDHGRRVVDARPGALVERARQQPQPVHARDFLVALLGRSRQRLGAVEGHAVAREFREHDHVDPGKAAPGGGDLRRNDIHIVAGAELQLERGQAETPHATPLRTGQGCPAGGALNRSS